MAKPVWFVVYWTNGSWTAFRDPLAAQMLADDLRQPVLGRDGLPSGVAATPIPRKPLTPVG